MGERNVKSAERTLALFELFSAEQRPLRIGEMAKMLGMPQPSVTMLVRNLVALGYIEHDPAKRTYVPTMRIALLGSWIHQRFTQERQLEWRLEVLQEAVDETVIVGQQNGIHMQYVLFIRPSYSNRFDVQAERNRPMAVSAAGKILLSLKSDKEVRALIHRANAEETNEDFRVNVGELLETLSAVRTAGFAETHGEVRPGIATIAMALPSMIGRSPMAIAVAGEVERIASKRGEILKELEKFCRVIANEMPPIRMDRSSRIERVER